MDRNDKRYWYDRGYGLGAKETRRDAVIPRLIGAWLLFGMAYIEIWICLIYLIIYTLWTLSNWNDQKRACEKRREFDNPGKKWE